MKTVWRSRRLHILIGTYPRWMWFMAETDWFHYGRLDYHTMVYATPIFFIRVERYS